MKNDRTEKRMKTGRLMCWLNHDQNGFSLVEVMVIVVIISLLIVFAAPDFSNWQPNIKLKQVADNFYAHMQQAKITAIKTNVDVMLNITEADSPCPAGAAGNHGSYILWYTDSGGTTQIVAQNPKTGAPPSGDACGDDSTIWETDFQCLGVCLETSNFNSGSAGFSSRGLPLDMAGNNVTFIHPKSGFAYTITQKASGGVTRQKN